MKRIEGRIALVTGAAGGIGRATAVRLAEKGAHVALADVNESGLDETRSRVERLGVRATTHLVDVADRAAMEDLVRQIESAHGGLHVLVNNAGVAVSATFEDHTLEDFQWLIGINFWGVVHGCKLFMPLLRQADEAHIVNVSSVFGLIGMPMNSAYCASKFAVYGLSESLRVELSDTHIGVTCVQPGGVATDIVKSARWTDDPAAAALRPRTERAFARMMPPERAAKAIVRGIERNSHRVLITREAHVIDAAKRAFPSLTSALVARGWRRAWTGIVGR